MFKHLCCVVAFLLGGLVSYCFISCPYFSSSPVCSCEADCNCCDNCSCKHGDLK